MGRGRGRLYEYVGVYVPHDNQVDQTCVYMNMSEIIELLICELVKTLLILGIYDTEQKRKQQSNIVIYYFEYSY